MASAIVYLAGLLTDDAVISTALRSGLNFYQEVLLFEETAAFAEVGFALGYQASK